MERFIIKDIKYDYRPIRLYYSDIEEARQKYPNAEILLDTDTEYLNSVEKIKAISLETIYDYKGRKVWKIPHNNAFILYRQFVDEGGKYIDGCEYQRWDNITSVTPIGWNMSTPKEFEELFIKELPLYDRNNPCISQRELKKRKAKKFYGKNGKYYWLDSNGFFYQADKANLPNKSEKEEYERFKDNSEAVLVKYGTEVAFSKREWFDSIEDFNIFFDNAKRNHPKYLAELEYEVLKRGYTKPAPDDRCVIVAMPYIDIDKEINLAKKDTANENSISRTVANIWCKQMEGIRFFGMPCNNIEWVEDVVKRYIETIQ